MRCEDGSPTASWTRRRSSRRWRSRAAMFTGARSHAGGGIPGQPTRNSRRTRDGAELDLRRQAVACQRAAHRQDPSVAAAPLPSGRTGPVGHQRARLAGGSWAETVPYQHDRRCLQPAARAVRAARFDRRKHAFGVELRGAAWPAGELLHRQGGVVSNGAENGAVCHRTAPGTTATRCPPRRSDEPSGNWTSCGSGRTHHRQKVAWNVAFRQRRTVW